MYDPKIARFLQEDTYRGDPNDPLSLNLYTYCANNPLVYYDPTGHSQKDLWGYFTTGFETLFLSSEEEREDAFNLVYEYGGDDAYTSVVTAIASGLGEVGDLYKDPVKQMEENNRIFKPFVTDTLGIEEGTDAYNIAKGIGTSLEAFSTSGVEMIKGTINTGLTIGSYIGNRAILDINTVGLVAGKVSAKQYISSLETIINDVEAIKSMPGAMATGIKNSVVNLATNGLDFFSYETSLAEKTQLVTDFTTVVGTVEAAHGLYKLAKPHLSSLRQRISSSNWYRTLASERGSVSLGPNSGASEAKLIKNKFPTEPLPSNGRIIDYTIENGQIKGVNGQRNLDFVVDSEGKLILGKKHHTLGNGQDVLGAGQLKLDGQGRIRRIDNLSGHYQPTVNEALNYPELFKQNGLNVKNAWLELYDIKVDSAGWVENYVKAVSKKIK
jgi:hypothetical protein